MTLLQCDRCGKVYKLNPDVQKFREMVEDIVSAFIPPSRVDECISEVEAHFDLCPDCRNHLKNWLKGKEDELYDEQSEDNDSDCEDNS